MVINIESSVASIQKKKKRIKINYLDLSKFVSLFHSGSKDPGCIKFDRRPSKRSQ